MATKSKDNQFTANSLVPSRKKPRYTAATAICEMAGLSISEVCRSAEISEERFKKFARDGKAPNVAAERLCHVLGSAVDPMIFIFGYERWKQLLGNRKSGDAFPSVGRRQRDTHRRQRPVSILTRVE